MDMKNLKSGQIIYVLDDRHPARSNLRIPSVSGEWRVTKVGRIYFYAKKEGSPHAPEYRFGINSGRCVIDYYRSLSAFISMQDSVEHAERRVLEEDVSMLLHASGNHLEKLTTPELNDLFRLLKKLKNRME